MALADIKIDVVKLLGKSHPLVQALFFKRSWASSETKGILNTTEDEACSICKEPGGREPKAGLRCGTCFACAVDKGVVHECLEGTFDPEGPRLKKDEREILGQKNGGTVIQSLVFDKKIFSKDEAVEWAKSRNFKFEKVDTKENTLRLRQLDPNEFDKGGFGEGQQFRSVVITKGVTATIGFLSGSKAEDLPIWGKSILCDVIAGLSGSKSAPGSQESEVIVPDDPKAPAGAKSSAKEITVNVPDLSDAKGLAKLTDQVAKALQIGTKGETRDVKTEYSICKVDLDRRLVTGPAMVPNKVDTQGDFELAEEIEEAAHNFLIDARGVDDMHEVFEGIGVPVESFILRRDEIVGKNKDGSDRILEKGTWMLTVKVTNPDTWLRVKSGELTGFSIVFRGEREAVHA